MKKVFASVLTSGLFLAFTGWALAADTALPKPIVVKDKVTMKATVESIDQTNRVLTLKGPKGKVLTLAVDDSVARFDQIKVGDVITATYYESVAYDIQAPGTPSPDTSAGGAAPLAGTKPGGAAVTMTVTTVTVEAIDPKTPAVTVKTADGDSLSFRVRHKENLKNVKVGDLVVVTHTEALMIAVEAPK